MLVNAEPEDFVMYLSLQRRSIAGYGTEPKG